MEGLWAARRGDLERARRAFEAARAAAPESARILHGLAFVEAHLGREARALKLSGMSLARDPADEEALRLFLTLALRTRAYASAARSLALAAEQAEAPAPLRTALGVLLDETGDEEGALAAYAEAARADSSDPRPLARAAEIHERRGRPLQAAALLEEASRRDPRDADVLRSLARWRERLGLDADARRAWRALLEVAPGDDEALRRAADLATEAGDYAEAAGHVAALAARWPADRRLLAVLGALREAAGDHGAAAAAYRLYAEADRGIDADSAVWLRIAVLEIRAGDTRGAASAFARVLERTDDLDVRILAATSYLAAGRETEALPLLEAARVARPEDTRLLYAVGVAYDALGRRDEALEAFQALVRKDPTNATALNYVGYTWAERGEHLEEALVLIERALQIEPENPAYLDSLGWVLYRLGRIEEAVRPIEAAAKALPDDSVIRGHLEEVRRNLKPRRRRRGRSPRRRRA